MAGMNVDQVRFPEALYTSPTSPRYFSVRIHTGIPASIDAVVREAGDYPLVVLS